MLKPGQKYNVHLGDCIPHMAEMEPNSMDFSVFSPPFPALYSYTSEEADIGNSDDLASEMNIHFSFFMRQLFRVIKPGRVCVMHLMQIPHMKRTGGDGLIDFRGILIRIARRAGFVYDFEWIVRKNPQAQAIRTKSRELQFAGLESDRSKQRGCLPDYLLKFRKPGENKVKIDAPNQVSRNDWIKWAESCWDDIIETDTLNVAEGRSEDDTKHICPLQIEVIRRLVLLYTNPDEVVFSPFTGIGSEGFVSLGGASPKTGRYIADPRRFYGCELKPEYHATAMKNLRRAEQTPREQNALFEMVGVA